MPAPNVPKCRTKSVDPFDEQPKAAFGQVHGEKITSAHNEVAAIIRHRPMGFALLNPSYASLVQ
jgi:hypothetical protein